MTRLTSLAQATGPVLECRDFGHAWSWENDPQVRLERGKVVEFETTDACLRCEARRTRTIEAPSMTILRTRMTYPDGYLAPRGTRYRRADARAERFDRMMSRRNTR